MSKLEKFVQEPNEPEISAEENAKIEEFVRREYLREAEEIERALTGDVGTDEVPDDMYDKIIQKLKDRGTYFDDDETTEENSYSQNNNNKVVAMPRRYRAAKWVAIACITCIGIFGVSMTSEANRAYMMNQVNSLVGNEVSVTVDNKDDRDTTSTEEEEAAALIEEQLLVDVPGFYYKPTGMKFESVEIQTEFNVALMNYLIDDKALHLYIATNEEDAARAFGLDGDLISYVENEYQGIQVAISTLQNEGQAEPLYIAQWSYKNNYYIINAMIDLEEFQNMLSNMVY